MREERTRAGWPYILNDPVLLPLQSAGAEPVAGDMWEQQRKLSVRDAGMAGCGSAHSK